MREEAGIIIEEQHVKHIHAPECHGKHVKPWKGRSRSNTLHANELKKRIWIDIDKIEIDNLSESVKVAW
jgi:hypothetical protein